mmetsp:Transcript_17032/g.14976  ORF Transcript_17032/g.14976 Transcript_17032/m.14976 type:complete len:138 (+) Transcript_17032:346-759(+)
MIRELAPVILARKEGNISTKPGLLNKRSENLTLQNNFIQDKSNEDLLVELQDENLEEIDKILNQIIGVKKPEEGKEEDQNLAKRSKSNYSKKDGSTFSKLEKLEGQIERERKLRKKQEEEIFKLRQKMEGIYPKKSK